MTGYTLDGRDGWSDRFPAARARARKRRRPRRLVMTMRGRVDREPRKR